MDIEAWEGEPTFRANGKVLVFAHPEFSAITVKLPKEEAAAVVASDQAVSPTGYGLGRHGWISVDLPTRLTRERREEVEEWILTSYTLVAPKTLARQLLAGPDAEPGGRGR